MALTQEEIRIKAGLDYSKVTAGLTDIRAQVFKLAKDVPNKLGSLLKANVYTAAAGIISEILPSWDEIWNRVYNTGPEAMKRSEEMSKNFRTIREEFEKNKKELAAAEKKADYEDANQGGKYEMLQGDLAMAEKIVAKKEEELEAEKALRNYYKSGKAVGVSQARMDEVGLSVIKNESELLRLKKERLAAERAIKNFEDENAKTIKGFSAQKTNAEFENLMNNQNKEVFKSRLNLRSINEALRRNPNDPDALEAQRQELATIQDATSNRSVKGMSSIGNLMGNLDSMMPGVGFNQMKESILLAQQEAMKSIIQRVAIVEISDK